MGRRTEGRVGGPVRETPVSDMVRVTASRPLLIAKAPEERIVPGMAPLGASVAPLRDAALPVPGRPGSVAARAWPAVPSPVPSDDELLLPSSERCGATELARERFDAFEVSWPMMTGLVGSEGADDASEMGEIGGMLIVCSLRNLPVLFGRRS